MMVMSTLDLETLSIPPLAAIRSLLLTTLMVITPYVGVVVAFAPPRTTPIFSCAYKKTTAAPHFATKEAPLSSEQQKLVLSQSSLEKLETIKLALKRPRGASIGVEYYAPHSSEAPLSDGDLTILSMQLRKSSKCAAIWTSDATSVAKFAKEQEGARGDFPGPVPVIYYSGSNVDLERVLEFNNIGEAAAAVVVDYDGHKEVDFMESLKGAGIIWKVTSLDQLQKLSDMENQAGGVYLLSSDILPQSVPEENDKEDDDDDDQSSDDQQLVLLKEALSALPKSAVTIAPLPTMLPSNSEIPLAKYYANSLGVSSILLQGACVGDEEDVKYAQWAVESIGKKSSSSFSMTGLTGSTNGHFGVSSHGGEVKWRRNNHD